MPYFTPLTLVPPCPPHVWAFAPTVVYYECMNCRERRDYGHPRFAEAQAEYESSASR